MKFNKNSVNKCLFYEVFIFNKQEYNEQLETLQWQRLNV